MFNARLIELQMELNNYGCDIKFVVTITGIDIVPIKIAIQSINFLHVTENSGVPTIFLSLPHCASNIECKGLDVLGKCHISYGEMILMLQALEKKCLLIDIDINAIQAKVEEK